ncbi:MAG: pantetheine-phosphate adenylyltransferase [Bacilli bacterium]|nr:pantetheine-phosphate adenylyltransferase [Bacilli bacterium]
MKVAIYPGSFDPITNGHLDVLNRALKIFDKVIVLVAINPKKKSRFSAEERVEMIKEAVNNPNVEVDASSGLTVEYAKSHGATHLIRGLRAVTDFEYEFQLASANDFIDSNIDTVFLMSKNDKSFINSSMIMELHEAGVDVSSLVPPSVTKRLK